MGIDSLSLIISCLIINFSSTQMFFTAFDLRILRYFKLKIEGLT